MKAVVFDVDDTLYLERDYVRSGFAAVDRHLRESIGLKDFADTAWRLFEDGLRGRIFDAALHLLHAEGVSVTDLVDVYRSHPPQIRLSDDSTSVLNRLAVARVPIGLITDGSVVSQRAKVRALGLEDVASALVVTGELGSGMGKPHEAAFKLVESQLGVPPEGLTYVADNPAKDFVAPHRRGWYTVRVRRPGSLHESVPSGTDVRSEHRSLSTVRLP